VKIEGKRDKISKSNNRTRYDQDEGKKYKRSIVLQLKDTKVSQ